VTANPKNLKFVEASDIVQVRSLPDVDAAAIVNNFASEAGLFATRDGIAVERKDHNPYVNVIAVREQDKNAPWVKNLVKAYQSPEVRTYIETHFNGSVIPAF
jgi:D-methionine transport system substrate-binding protein